MRLSWLAIALIACFIHLVTLPTPQRSHDFDTTAKISVDQQALSFSSAVAIREARKNLRFEWVRIHFYAFHLTPDDISAAKTGEVTPMDHKSNKNFIDPNVHSNVWGVIQPSVDDAFKVWQVDISIPGRACTIASTESEVDAFLQDYNYDGETIRLKTKGSHSCDLSSVGAGLQNYRWDIDVSVPVFKKSPSK